ncbi:hypothetical protein SUDANB121_01911 [Nocardiopsis dassonvillei]|uniref:cupin domain-containing protein n=1 Tax=Nocardiopsis dassonvillei TaxID=2014 RepID=UPI003F57A9A0
MNTLSGLAPFVARVADVDLEPEPLDPARVVSGAPVVSSRTLWESADGSQSRGVWQITPGTVTDTEADEVFVVLSGRATVEVEGGPVLEVGPGDVCLLRAGDRTRWTVHETLRKVYHVTEG